MKKVRQFDNRFLIIGSGPGGDAVANRLAQLGAKRVLIIEQGTIGGTCVNFGCIPTHFVLHNLLLKEQISNTNRRHRLFNDTPQIDFNAFTSARKKVIENFQYNIMQNYKRNGIELIHGTARILTPNKVEISKSDDTVTFKTAETIIIASGASFTGVDVPGLDSARDHLIRADRIMELPFDRIPKSIVIWGLDSPAVEIAGFLRLLGANVILLSPQSSVLSFGSYQLGKTIEQMLEFHDIEFYKNVKIKKFVKVEDNKLSVEFSDSEKDNNRLESEFFVNALERQANLECIQGLPLELKGNRPVFSEPLHSSIENIYFLGDVRSGKNIPFRSHLAAFGGKLLAERLMGNPQGKKVDLSLIPRGMTTIDFQVAKIGLTEYEAIDKRFDVKILQMPNSHNAYAQIIGQIEGYVSVIIETSTGRILGGEIIGPDAINLITVIGTAIACKGTIEDLKKLPGFHPSLSEGIFDCAWL